MAQAQRSSARISRRRKPVQDRSRETVRIILEAAAQVFERRGYAATTDQIAARAGVSIGSLYQYFPNKDSLLVALGEAHLLEAMARLRPLLARLRADDLEPHAAVRELVRTSLVNNSPRPRLHRILHEQPAVRRAVGRRAQASMGEVTAVLAAYLAGRPDVAVRTPALAAVLLTESIMSLIHEFALIPPEGFTTDDCEAELVALFCGYLAGAGADLNRS